MYIKLLLGMALVGCISVRAETISLQVPPQQILKMVQAGNENFELPEIEVFNSKGNLIFYKKSLSKSFREELEVAIKSSIEGHQAISQSLEGLTDQSNHPFNLAGRTFDIAIVEYWAEWCVPCREQQKIIESYIRQNNKINILWLKVEKDPTKIEGIEIKKG